MLFTGNSKVKKCSILQSGIAHSTFGLENP